MQERANNFHSTGLPIFTENERRGYLASNDGIGEERNRGDPFSSSPRRVCCLELEVLNPIPNSRRIQFYNDGGAKVKSANQPPPRPPPRPRPPPGSGLPPIDSMRTSSAVRLGDKPAAVNRSPPTRGVIRQNKSVP